MTIAVGVDGFTDDEVAAILWLLSPYKILRATILGDSDIIISKDDLDCSKPLVKTHSTAPTADYTHPRSCGDRIEEIPMALITACSNRFQAVMSPRIALSYKVATSLPFQYNVVPQPIRNWLLRRHEVDFNVKHHVENELARQILVEAFARLGFPLEMKNAPSLLITHDIETKRGLERAAALKAVEDKLNISSTWFVLSDEYPIPKQIAKELAEGSTIGSHDTRHDGRLIRMHRQEELVDRLTQSRAKLETIFEKDVHRFRSPLLQFSRKIALALSEAGYGFDFSIPCWDPVSPFAGTGFGIQFLHSFEIGAMTEIPLTLIQDHQLLSVLGMKTDEAVEFLIEQAKLVRAFSGDIVVLVHPDYAFSQDLEAYSRLLTSLLEIHNSPQVDRVSCSVS